MFYFLPFNWSVNYKIFYLCHRGIKTATKHGLVNGFFFALFPLHFQILKELNKYNIWLNVKCKIKLIGIHKIKFLVNIPVSKHEVYLKLHFDHITNISFVIDMLSNEPNSINSILRSVAFLAFILEPRIMAFWPQMYKVIFMKALFLLCKRYPLLELYYLS